MGFKWVFLLCFLLSFGFPVLNGKKILRCSHNVYHQFNLQIGDTVRLIPPEKAGVCFYLFKAEPLGHIEVECSNLKMSGPLNGYGHICKKHDEIVFNDNLKPPRTAVICGGHKHLSLTSRGNLLQIMIILHGNTQGRFNIFDTCIIQVHQSSQIHHYNPREHEK